MALITLHLATIADAEQIREIYNYEVQHTTATFDLVPRTLAEQQQWLAERSGAFATIVAVDADPAPDAPAPTTAVVGFGALSAYKERAASNSDSQPEPFGFGRERQPQLLRRVDRRLCCR